MKTTIINVIFLFLMTVSFSQVNFAAKELLSAQTTDGYQPALIKYRKELNRFRKEFCVQEMPDIKFFLFGMANRTKFLYKKGMLINSFTGDVLYKWNLTAETIIPNEYKVVLETTDNKSVTIFESDKGVFIDEGSEKKRIPGTDYVINLPSFSKHKYSEILKVLHQELLINVYDSKPVPNYFVYKKPWVRDAALMAMCFEHTDNLHVIKDWVLSLDEVYDLNNGEAEGDNLGQTLYLLSLFTDKNHPLVGRILEEAKKREKTGEIGKYITGRTDGSERPAYASKWLKFGLYAMGLEDNYVVPDIDDGYNTLMWWMEKDIEYKEGHVVKNYPYISWAQDHYFGRKNNPISNRDYPLTWEIRASAADYPGMAIIDERYVLEKNASPHTWHAAEVFLYLTDPKFRNTFNVND